MINTNYRYTHLARLIQIINGPLPGMQAIRRLDLTFGTSYFNDIFHGHHWPSYVRWFGLEDHLADMATDYAAEIYDADDFGDWLSRQKKIKSGSIDGFTPTHDPYLREELSLNHFEHSWLFGANRTNLRRELFKNRLLYEPSYGFTGYATRMNLTYALFARRQHGGDKLFAFCLAQAILSELILKLFELPYAGQFRPLPPKELLTSNEPIEAILDMLQPSIAWSFDQDAINWYSKDAMDAIAKMLSYEATIQSGQWPSRAASEEILSLVTGHAEQATLLKLCAPAPFNEIVDLKP
jgi:hypothetical protein